MPVIESNIARFLTMTFCTTLACIAVAASVNYKPWGVPDARRQDYDNIIAKMDRRIELKAALQGQARPIVNLSAPTIHDFGFLEPHSKVECSFEIHNDGDQPLDLAVVAPDLDNDVLHAKLQPEQIASGANGRVTVTLDLKNDPFPEQGYSLVVQTNDLLMEQVTFTCQGKLREELSIPKSIYFPPSDLAEKTHSEFVVYSQIWDQFSVEEIQCDLAVFDWHAEPIQVGSELIESGARSAWKIQLWTAALEYGKHQGLITLSARPTGQPQCVESHLACRVEGRSPIVFHSPEIHQSDGLDIGTLFTGKQHEFHLLVRSRGDLNRKISVLDIKPDELRASLAPLKKQGDYRLTLTVPADCPMVVFNAAEKHGYISVGDPKDTTFSNWFPVNGAVVELER